MINLKVIKINQIEDVAAHFDPLNAEDFEKLVKSIEEIGLIYPLVVRKDDQNKYILIDGRNRLRALNRLGIDEAPVIVIEEAAPEIASVIDTIMQIDVEIARRHLDPTTKQAKYQERQHYTTHLCKTLRNKIFKISNGDTKNVAEILDNITLKQLTNIYKAYSQLNKIPTLLDKIFLPSENKLSLSEKEEDEKILQVKTEYEKIINTKENELKTQAEIIAKLTDEKNRLLEKYNEAKNQYERIVKNLQDVKQEMENKIREQVQQELELLKELNYEKDEAKIEEIKAKIEASVRQEYEEKIKKLKEQEIEWNKNVNTIRLELAKKTKEVEEKDAKIKQLQENLNLISSEKARLQSALKDFIAKFKAINTHTIVEKLIELLKMPATNIIYLINTLNPKIIPGEEEKLLRMWEDTKAIINQADEIIKNWITQQNVEKDSKKE